MLAPQFLLPIAHELIVDLFAGGGGASTGIELALGRHVDVAVNHDAEAISLHQANHPQTRHFCSDVFEVDPVTVTDGMPVGLLWASPDCKHFSKAKGGKPVSKKIRSLAWVVIKWAKAVRPRVICLENVEEFQTWGPLSDDGRPCPLRKGDTFRAWKRQLQELGYTVEHRELRACDYGAPTIRKRLFLVARCDGQPIVWPTPTHAQPDKAGKVPVGMKPWRTAADCIDWSIPAPSIFERKKPLADATCRRIAKGVMRYVVDAAEPFIVPTGHNASTGDGNARNHQPHQSQATDQNRPHGRRAPPNRGVGGVIARNGKADECTDAIDGKCNQEPAAIRSGLPSLGRAGEIALRTPKGSDATIEGDAAFSTGRDGTHEGVATAAAHTLVTTGYGERPGQAPRVPGLEKPLGTVVAGQKHALVSAFMAKHYTGVVGSDLADPLGTVTCSEHHSLITAHVTKFRASSVGSGADEPVHTITAGGETARPSTGNVMGLVTANLVHMGHGEGACGTKRFSHGVRDVAQPLNTVTASGAAAGLVTSHMVKLRGDNVGAATDEPVHTVSAQGLHHGEARAFMVKYYGTDQDPAMVEPLHTVTTKDRFGLVTIKGQAYAIVDIGLRMLAPRELYRAQGFPESYIIDRGAAGEAITKTAQVRMCGNSVCPPLARALVASNYTEAAAMPQRMVA